MKRATLVSLWLMTAGVDANTIAYWRFEGDGTNVPDAGGTTQVEDTNGRTTTATGEGIKVIDVSGNGNTVWAWEHPWAGHVYTADVPFATVPQSGAANAFSVTNSGDYPAMFTWSAQSSPGGTNLDTWTSSTWTIEASIKCTNLGGWRTFVGREGNTVSPDPAAAPIYFQKMGDGSNRVRIAYADVAGHFWQAVDTTAITFGAWHSFAASCDGTTLKLYRKDATDAAYRLVASTDVSSSTNSALVNPGTDVNGDAWGWTLGRGRYGTSRNPNDNHGDRWIGSIDEVRISNVALPPTALLGVAGSNDQDGDDLPDAWETLHGLNPNSAAGDDGKLGDFDHDGWTNIAEFNMGTDPADPLTPGAPNGDYDQDGLDDKWEVAMFGSAMAQSATGDPDGDGANNLAEYQANSNPMNTQSTPTNVNGTGAPDTVKFLGFTAAENGLKDAAGTGVGFDTRLPGTGTTLAANDPNLVLDTLNGTLRMTTTNSDLNGQNNLGEAEMIGIRLSSLGFTGTQDFKARAKFINLPATAGADQIGIFAGGSSTAVVRGGVIGTDTALGVNTNGANDSDAAFIGGNGALRAGISLTVEISRIGGVWHLTANGVDATPTVQPTFLDPLTDLVVGVYGCHLFSDGAKTAILDSFSAVCYDATPSTTDTDHDGMLDSWELAKFGNLLADPAGDADHDGVSNFNEFAFAGEPLDASSRGLITTSLTDTNSDSHQELTLTVAVRAGAVFSAAGDGSQTATVDGVHYTVRGSLDLVTFTRQVSHVNTVPSGDPGYELQTFRLDESEGLAGKGFLQIKASSN
ncbi:hypothetical protein [Luteolibacter sp. LG18]|uniref:hypothetical protein n=1 Tax=Luteolibacter sp. LG18 TaxID=2819286 RepID=UPI0030C6936B